MEPFHILMHKDLSTILDAELEANSITLVYYDVIEIRKIYFAIYCFYCN